MTQSKYVIPAALFAVALMAAPLAQAQTPAAPPAAAPRAHHAMSEQDETAKHEHYIAALHDALKVTPAQEEAWKPVAQTMRDNEKTAHELAKDKLSKMDSQSAADDLNAYADIAANHAQAMRKLADSFGTFYASLSDDQKKSADEFFRAHKRHHHPMQGHKGADASH